MDNEQREYHVKEFEKLDALRLDHAKLSAKVDFVECELRAAKTENNTRFERLEVKIDSIQESINNIKIDVREIVTRYGAVLIVLSLLAQAISFVLAKMFGI